MKFNHLQRTLSEFEQFTRHQAKKGYTKYNQALDPYEPVRNWLDMEAEELADAWQYNRAMKARIALVVEKIKKRTDDVEIHHYLDFLEGK